MCRVLACYLLGPLFTDWASGCYVYCGCIGSTVFSFPVDGARVGELLVHLFYFSVFHFFFSFPVNIFVFKKISPVGAE